MLTNFNSRYHDKLDEMYKEKPIDNDTGKWEGGEGIDLYFKKGDKYLDI